MGADAIAFCLDKGHSWDTGAKPYCLVCGVEQATEAAARAVYSAGHRDGKAAGIAEERAATEQWLLDTLHGLGVKKFFDDIEGGDNQQAASIAEGVVSALIDEHREAAHRAGEGGGSDV